MKKFYAILCLAIASLTQLQAQAPQGFNYQATVRNSSGDLIVNTNVYFKFNVIQGSQTAVPIFTEMHYVPTDDLGQVNLVIGQGTPSTGIFSELDWSLGSYYLGIELSINGTNDYVAMGTTQLLSVPYALYAENSGNSTPTTPNLEAVLLENNSANSQQIKDLQDPTEAQDAVTLAVLQAKIEEINLNIDHDGDGYTENQGDCDDTDPFINSGTDELEGDGIDNDCDGEIDEYDGENGISIFDPNSDVFNNPVSNESELIIMLSNAQELLTSYSWLILTSEIASDNSTKGGESSSDVIGLYEIENFTHSSSNNEINRIWNFMYAGYNRSSYAYLKANEISNVSPNYIAEALFLKSFYAYNLVEWFGHFPLIFGYDPSNNPILESSDLGMRNELLSIIASDLENAISLTVSHGVSSSGRTIITKNAMLAYLSKTQAKLGDLQGAIGNIDQIISSGQHSLVTNYETIFDDQPTASSVFDIDCTGAFNAGFGCVLCSQGNVMVGFSGIRNYQGPIYRSGFSFNIPTNESYNSFESGDIRRDVAILDIVAWAEATGATYGEGFQHTGFFNNKYLPVQGNTLAGDINLTNPNDIKVVRYAELLLLRSELSLRSGDYSEALRYLNLVRTRAGLSNISNSNNLMNDIIQERRSEFMGEGKRFFDLVHFGIATQNLPNFFNGKHEVFPIPQYFIDLVGGLIPQNPGY